MALKKTFVKGYRLLASDLNQLVSEINRNANMFNFTYSELKTLRDNSQLIPGATYRITDYTCTTSQVHTFSAGHVFDILVTADDVDKLNENARAIQHSGDTYFTGSDLNAWELKYCLDNDTDRFSWAVTGDTGRGVIYYMKDEWNNECPYDFKNIQFVRYKITDCPKSPSLVGQYSISGLTNITVNTAQLNPIYCYTFTVLRKEPNFYIPIDVSTKQNTLTNDERGYCKTENNVIKEFYQQNDNDATYYLTLPNNVFITDNEILADLDGFFGYANNTLGNDCYNNTFGNSCSSNTFGNCCSRNTFGNICGSNTFGNSCGSNTFGNSCNRNTFGNSCNSNTFGNSCNGNIFGNNCYSNTFGNSCNYNTFGNNCYSNTFGNSCNGNTFGNNCVINTLGTSCNSNTFNNNCGNNKLGNSCSINTFGNECIYNTINNYFQNNTFGNECIQNTINNYFQNNTFGNNVSNNVFSNDYVRYCTFFDGVKYLNVSVTTTNAQYLQNMQILNGTQGTNTNKLNIINSVITSGLVYSKLIGKNSNGNLTTKPHMGS